MIHLQAKTIYNFLPCFQFVLNPALLTHKSYAAISYAFNAEKDYYKILGVSQGATQKEIKTAYYNLAKKYHPDVNKGREELFKEIADAYSILGEESVRKEYDSIRRYSKGTSFRNTQSSHFYRQRNTRTSYRTGQNRYTRYTNNNFYDQDYEEKQEHYEQYYNYYGESRKQRSREEQEEEMLRNYFRRFYGANFYDFEEFLRQMNEKIRQHEAYEDAGNRKKAGGSTKRSWSDRRKRDAYESSRTQDAERQYRKQLEEEFQRMQNSFNMSSKRLVNRSHFRLKVLMDLFRIF